MPITLKRLRLVRKVSQRSGRDIETVPEETALTEWSWPGNIQELGNLIEESILLSEGPALYVPLLELRAEDSIHKFQSDQSLYNADREHIVRILRENREFSPDPMEPRPAAFHSSRETV